ncbi:hypothetical protein HY504_02070 [Candidatus Wolfebacteria bacterium]|nr:hypothetical protein [Candidatus Wolfebacteria bacterium]
MRKENMRRILEQLPSDIPAQKVSATLIVNSPNERADDTYGRPRLTEVWSKIQKEISGAGIKSIRIEELPLDETAILFSPETPNVAHAVGAPIEIGEKGEYIFHPQEIAEQDIALAHASSAVS